MISRCDTQSSPDGLFKVLPFLVDERIGIIRHVGELAREAGTPEFFHFYAQACDTRAMSRQQNFANAGGVSMDRSTAMAKAIGEAVERYCAAIYDIEEFPYDSFDAASFECVNPESFALYMPFQYHDEDFPYDPFRRDTPVRWTIAQDLTTGRHNYVPASMVFLPYAYDQTAGEVPIIQPISTGLACHSSWNNAAISAICEVIERDAFSIAWQAKISPPHIHLESLSEWNYEMVKRFERAQGTVTLLNITLEHGIPTVLAILRSYSPELPSLIFAASTSLDPDDAIRKCLEELAHTRRQAHSLKANKRPIVPEPGFTNFITQDSHLRFYSEHSSAHWADFIFSSGERISFDRLENRSTHVSDQDLHFLVKRLKDLNYEVLIADVTTVDVQQLGLHVVRAIIPGFHPLFMGHKFRALGGRRLWEAPQKCGYPGISRASGDNPAPHPYP